MRNCKYCLARLSEREFFIVLISENYIYGRHSLGYEVPISSHQKCFSLVCKISIIALTLTHPHVTVLHHQCTTSA